MISEYPVEMNGTAIYIHTVRRRVRLGGAVVSLLSIKFKFPHRGNQKDS